MCTSMHAPKRACKHARTHALMHAGTHTHTHTHQQLQEDDSWKVVGLLGLLISDMDGKNVEPKFRFESV